MIFSPVACNLPLPQPKSYEVKKKEEKPQLHLDLFGDNRIAQFDWRNTNSYPLIFPYFLYGKSKIKTSSNEYCIYEVENGDCINTIDRDQEGEIKLLQTFFNSDIVIPLHEKYPDINLLKKYQDCLTFSGDFRDEIDQVPAVMQALHQWKEQGISISINLYCHQ